MIVKYDIVSNLQFKIQLSTSDSTQITAGAPKVPVEDPVPQDTASGKIYLYLTRVLYHT